MTQNRRHPLHMAGIVGNHIHIVICIVIHTIYVTIAFLLLSIIEFPKCHTVVQGVFFIIAGYEQGRGKEMFREKEYSRKN